MKTAFAASARRLGLALQLRRAEARLHAKPSVPHHVVDFEATRPVAFSLEAEAFDHDELDLLVWHSTLASGVDGVALLNQHDFLAELRRDRPAAPLC